MLTKKLVAYLLLSVCFVVSLFCFKANAAKQTDIISPKEKEEIPSKNKIEKTIKISKKLEDKILDKVPVAGKIIDETIYDKTRTVIWTLSNGAKVVLKNTSKKIKDDFENNGIEMVALAKGGLLNVAQKDIVSAKLAYYLIEDSYFGKSKRTIGLEGLRFRMDLFTHQFAGQTNKGISGTKHLFELLYWTFTNSKIDSKAIAIRMAYEKASLEYMEYIMYPYSKNFDKEFLKIVYNNDPYFKSLESSDFAKFNKNTAIKLIKKYLNPADYTFVFVGDIDINLFRGYVEKYLASIPAGKEKSFLPEYRATYMGEVKYNKMYVDIDYNVARIIFIIREQHIQNNQVIADVLVKYLDSVICKYIRMKQMKAFSIYKNSNGVDRDLNLMIFFSTEDNNKLEENVTTVKEDLKEIAAGNINVDIFNQAKKTIKTEYERQLENNSFLAEKYAIFSAVYDKPFSAIYEQKKMYDAVTPKDLQEMVAKALQEGIAFILECPKN
jgi:zinc protease